MGIAEVIPGVSGGTIAFITGIYEELINTINSIDGTLLKTLKQGKFKEVWLHINGAFLLRLILGMLAGIVIGVTGVTYLLEQYPELLWAFFFGLILASVWVVYHMMKAPSKSYIVHFILGTIVAFGIVSLDPRPGSDSFIFIFISGMIAICALILPGISGSFILLLMGMYTLIIPTLKSLLTSPSQEAFIIMAVFAVGCLIGLLLFSRFLSWTFKHYHDPTLAVLCGFMMGSLPKIWPWRNPESYINKSSGDVISAEKMKTIRLASDDYELLTENNVYPTDYLGDPNTMLAILAIVVGFCSVILMKSLSKSDQHQ